MKELKHQGAGSPIVDRTIQRRSVTVSTRLAFSWGVLNALLAIAMAVELTYRPLSLYFGLKHHLFWYAECALMILFAFNTLVDTLRYLVPSLSSSVVELTPRQKRLMGVKDSEPGFKTLTPSHSKTKSPSTSTIISPTSSYTAYTGGGSPGVSPYNITLAGPSSPLGSPYSSGSSPGSSPSQLGLSGMFNQSMGGSYISSSFLNQSDAAASFNASYGKSGITGSPLTGSPLFMEKDTSGLRSRWNSPGSRFSPLTGGDNITDHAALEGYLKEQQEKEYRQQLSSQESSPSGPTSFWNYSRTAADYTPVLRKYQYQIACRSPQSTKRTDDPDDPSTYRADEVWLKAGVLPDQVDIWIENLRKWLGQTVMKRLAQEIEQVNQRLVQLGSEDMQIGEVSVASLKQLAVTKSQHIPSLNSIIPFLEASANQEYLVHRIRDLASTGCMSDYRWNSGGSYRGKPWGEHLPTDSLVIMHMLCSYMDARLPPHPKFPDGKTFTSQHFIRTPDKPNLKKTDNLLLYQSKINYPHYKVVIGEDVFDLPKGRNNMFQAILLFLHTVKTKECGMLGRVNLGMSGINILWVLESS